MVDFAVDVLCLVLDLVVSIVSLAEGVIQDILSVIKNGISSPFEVLEDLSVGDDKC